MRCLVMTPHRYGIREVAERVGKEWEAMGHDVDYLLARGDAAKIGPVTVGVPGIALWWYRKLGEAAEEDYDLVWTHQPVAPILPTKDPSFWEKVIVTFHTTLRAEYALAREGMYPAHLRPFHWVTKSLEERFYTRLEEVGGEGPRYTVVSPHLRREISGFGIDGAEYVPNGVFTPSQESFDPIRQEHGVPEDATLILYVGSLTPQKQPAEMAWVMTEVTRRAEDTYFVVAGKGPLREEVERGAGDRVEVLGYVSDEEKWRWLDDADLFLSLSAYEGMPVATLEALSFGVPPILSDIPSHRNVVERYTDRGRLVATDPSDVLDAVRDLEGTRAEASLPEWREIAEAYIDITSA